MKEQDKTIYVVGGTNGVGKSTIAEELLPKEIPYINADLIARKMGGQQPEYVHNEIARQLGSEQIKKHVDAGESFAFESNLHEKNTYKWLQQMKQEGYRIEVYYIGVDNLHTTTSRIEERVQRGEHHVPQNEVFARYENGIKLMKHYYAQLDKLYLIDNSGKHSTGMVLEKGQVVQQQENVPDWIKDFNNSLKQEEKLTIGKMKSIEDVRKAYEQLKEQAETQQQTNTQKNKIDETSKKLIEKKSIKMKNHKRLRPKR